MLQRLAALLLLLNSSLYADAQVLEEPCPTLSEPMSITERTVNNGVVTTIGLYDGDTRKVESNYTYQEWNNTRVGTMTVSGDFIFWNKTDDTRIMRYRASILVPEGLVPVLDQTQVPLNTQLCWEESTDRIVILLETVVDAQENVAVPFELSLLIRAFMLADLNVDGRVDALDQAILIDLFGTVGESIGDLNNDGIVDDLDLDILLMNWSDYSEDVVQITNAGGVDEGTIYNEDTIVNLIQERNRPWMDFPYIAIGQVNELVDVGQPAPRPVGVPPEGVFIVPFQDWRHPLLGVI